MMKRCKDTRFDTLQHHNAVDKSKYTGNDIVLQKQQHALFSISKRSGDRIMFGTISKLPYVRMTYDCARGQRL